MRKPWKKLQSFSTMIVSHLWKDFLSFFYQFSIIFPSLFSHFFIVFLSQGRKKSVRPPAARGTDCRVGAMPLLAMTVKGCRVINSGHSEGASPWESASFLASPPRGGGSADPEGLFRSRAQEKAPLCKGGCLRSRLGDCRQLGQTIPPPLRGTSLCTREALAGSPFLPPLSGEVGPQTR